jgi:shikimate kinase/3-dehydroquinate synthase
MATGKSTVGPLVAESAGTTFIDLDARVEQGAGASVGEIFRRDGEPAFRSLERAELERLLTDAGKRTPPPVIALGGGTLLPRDLRLAALDQAVVVTLTASTKTILERAQAHSGRPLLDVSDPGARVRTLLEERAFAYAEAHAGVATDIATPGALAGSVLAIWQRDPIAVAAGDRSYTVEVGAGIAARRLPDLVRDASRVLLVTDENVERHHGHTIAGVLGAKLGLVQVTLPPGEEHKNTASLERIWRAALEAGVDRKSSVVALGGGVVSDVAGFAAASWMRGVRWLVVPTTLLAMVDAAVGGKTAIDFGLAKNAVGAFWQPAGVLCDVSLLATEPDRGYRSALAEVVKTALIGDVELLELLEANRQAVLSRDAGLVAELVQRSIRVKARIVGLDEREGGLRAVLNLGHTVGHALEAQSGYARLTHGEAVSLGLIAALALGRDLGVTPAALLGRVERLLAAFGLPVDLGREPLHEAAALIGHDKKRAGDRLRFVVAREPGTVETQDLALDELRARVASLATG